jgi:predicted transcriptional regulator
MRHIMGVPDMVGALIEKYGSLSNASRKADISLGTLYRDLHGADARISRVVKIAEALDLTLAEAAVKYRLDTRDNGRSD